MRSHTMLPTPHRVRSVAEARRGRRDRGPRRNEQIRAPLLRVIDPEGTQVGVLARDEALYVAENLGLDLVEVSPDADPPVAKLMDWGRYRFEESKRERQARKASHRPDTKEVRLSLNIGAHDFEVMRRRADKFLASGDRVKLVLRLRGREMAHSDDAIDVVNRFIASLESPAKPQRPPALQGRSVEAILTPA